MKMDSVGKRVVVGVVVVVVAVAIVIRWAIRHSGDEAARKQVLAAKDVLVDNVSFSDIEGGVSHSSPLHLRPTPLEVREMLGRNPDGPINFNAKTALEQYTFEGPSKTYQLQIRYKRDASDDKLHFAKGKIIGNPFD